MLMVLRLWIQKTFTVFKHTSSNTLLVLMNNQIENVKPWNLTWIIWKTLCTIETFLSLCGQMKPSLPFVFNTHAICIDSCLFVKGVFICCRMSNHDISLINCASVCTGTVCKNFIITLSLSYPGTRAAELSWGCFHRSFLLYTTSLQHAYFCCDVFRGLFRGRTGKWAALLFLSNHISLVIRLFMWAWTHERAWNFAIFTESRIISCLCYAVNNINIYPGAYLLLAHHRSKCQWSVQGLTWADIFRLFFASRVFHNRFTLKVQFNALKILLIHRPYVTGCVATVTLKVWGKVEGRWALWP